MFLHHIKHVRGDCSPYPWLEGCFFSKIFAKSVISGGNSIWNLKKKKKKVKLDNSLILLAPLVIIMSKFHLSACLQIILLLDSWTDVRPIKNKSICVVCLFCMLGSVVAVECILYKASLDHAEVVSHC